jgi:SAM-dependent methyltransferase
MANPAEPGLFGLGDPYETYMGRWSRPAAREFISWLDLTSAARWLDVGCGTGAVCQSILQFAAPVEVVGIDSSAGFVAYASSHVTDRRARFLVGDAQALPDELADFDVTVSGLVLNFIPDKEEALRQMSRVTRPGGTVAAYVWDYAERMELMRFFWDVATRLDPSAAERDEGRRTSICNPASLEDLFGKFLGEVAVAELVVPTVFASFDDYWSPFLGAQGSAPAYVASLANDQRDRLKNELRLRLPYSGDGSIRLTARAWAVRGTEDR